MANVLTPAGRVSYPSVLKPTVNKLNNKTEYSVTLLFDKGADLSALKAEAKRALIKKFGENEKKWPPNIRSPFRDQAERAKEIDGKKIMPAGYVEGNIFVMFKSDRRPQVVDQKVQEIIDENEFYAGCYARATVQAYAYDNKGNRGVAFGLQNVQKVKDGDPLTGRTRAADDFAPVEMDSDDPSTATAIFN